ncbi:MAG: class 1 fructose-bisphosphatase [Pseudomonadota bacterium]|nr:class 1 fructose-bisphosphatase [Pseudomonadota bacterium]
MAAATLDAHLASYGASHGARGAEVAKIIGVLSRAAVSVLALIGEGAVNGSLAAHRITSNLGGDKQRELDVRADEIFLGALRETSVALYCSEELDSVAVVKPDGELAVAIDPLDGSSNIDTNVSIGTIFSVLPVAGNAADDPNATFLQPGRRQLAAGFFIYGPQLALALTLGEGTHIFGYSPRSRAFVQMHENRQIPARAQEFAINVSNHRHWDEPIRLYVEDCFKGADGPRERNFNMRWIASLVADTYRILIRGGVFLYPADDRKGYGRGHLRLVYEANPIALLIEQADGAATDCVVPILDIEPQSVHQKVPLVFGASREVARIGRYHTDPSPIGERSPLFGNRGLFRT